jgi:hypothetical protein
MHAEGVDVLGKVEDAALGIVAVDFRAGEGGFFLLMNFSFLEPEPAEKIFIKKTPRNRFLKYFKEL